MRIIIENEIKAKYEAARVAELQAAQDLKEASEEVEILDPYWNLHRQLPSPAHLLSYLYVDQNRIMWDVLSRLHAEYAFNHDDISILPLSSFLLSVHQPIIACMTSSNQSGHDQPNSLLTLSFKQLARQKIIDEEARLESIRSINSHQLIMLLKWVTEFI